MFETICIICITIVIIIAIVTKYYSGKPEYSCRHEYTEPTKIFNGTYSSQYFRQCKKCGKKDIFYGSGIYT